MSKGSTALLSSMMTPDWGFWKVGGSTASTHLAGLSIRNNHMQQFCVCLWPKDSGCRQRKTQLLPTAYPDEGSNCLCCVAATIAYGPPSFSSLSDTALLHLPPNHLNSFLQTAVQQPYLCVSASLCASSPPPLWEDTQPQENMHQSILETSWWELGRINLI